ncbi:Nup192p NDAI_0C02230 [Naumovozyma dairenensis CBS 421]|uniref:Nucleoporin n=1 Tax=Naumovozyma dairenensis (strain ATCC 10597 / BCRC 20456 / CBS 421 / NBRC 0211 / NRRL Y-12639) TaxID=1071378 RepID=G0W7X2_NAUDC|nr:hypothetical protein NDAI_0C02230 [Naumovozyma dairenensis CBS 421]CCD23883.1 hypothetical protein NDAI_0C02230 [Naumovozyma dairenensis CBS 421]
MIWSTAPFQKLYDSIENDQFDYNLFKELLPDLQQLNLTNDKPKNQKSRAQVESGKITLADNNIITNDDENDTNNNHNTITYNLKQQFIIATISLSDELNLDELIVAQLILSDLEKSNLLDSLDSLDNATTLIISGKRQFFFRRQFILQITAFLLNCLDTSNPILQELVQDSLKNNILKSFESIHQQLEDIKQSINKAKILENNNDPIFIQNIKFKRDFLLKEYDTLSQILTGLINKNFLLNYNDINNIINHIITSLNPNDYFIIYYLPALFNAFNKLEDMPSNDVNLLYSNFIKDLKNNDSIYEQPIKVTLIFIFLTLFIDWCNSNPTVRTKDLDFKTDIDYPMMLTVELGAIEQLLIIAADTSEFMNDQTLELIYDIRSLLETHIPRFRPIQLLDDPVDYENASNNDNNNNNTQHPHSITNNFSYSDAINTKKGITPSENKNLKYSNIAQSQYNNIRLSEQTQDFLVSSFHNVLQKVITNCAFLLTKIKDTEEDSLLSEADLTLDDIAAKADLERFFITIYFFYASRPTYSNEFWKDKESNAYGFIEWSSKCTDSLMRSCFYLMISSLSFGQENSTNVFHYFGNNSIVSWSTIVQCLKEYNLRISNLPNVIHQRQNLEQDTDSSSSSSSATATKEIDSLAIAFEEGLNEETTIFLSSLLTLVGSVAFDVQSDIKISLSGLFMDPIFEFAKLETPLSGACFKTLSYLLPSSIDARLNYWQSLDSILFKNVSLTNTTDSYRSAFGYTLKTFSEIVGFLSLFNNLLKINPQDINENGHLSFGKQNFPSKLGQVYRKMGIWPYFDYILNEIFVPSKLILNDFDRRAIQTPILEIIETSLLSFDYSAILNSITLGINLDTLVNTSDFFTYVQESPAPVVFNHLFAQNVHSTLFAIIDIGIDHISIDLEGGKDQMNLLTRSIKIINLILDFQGTFTEELLPIIIKQENKSYYIPKNFGLHGFRSFYDTIFFNLPVVAHLGLYVGLDDTSLVSESLKVLKKLSLNSPSNGTDLNSKNKLFTIFDAVDDSARIKDAFISQLEVPIENDGQLSLKIQLLNFINSNLSFTKPAVTVAHFLLGLQASNGISLGPELPTFINSDVSLLNSIVSILESSLDIVTPEQIQYAPMRLASISLEIILKLCRNPLTSSLLLDYLTNQHFFERIMEIDVHITKFTQWDGKSFDSLSIDSGFDFLQSESIGALLAFLSYRNYLIQYLGLFIHRCSFMGTKRNILTYVNFLITNKIYSTRIFSFLDSLNYENLPIDEHLFKNFKYLNALPLNLEKFTLNEKCAGNIYSLNDLNSLMSVAQKVVKPPLHATACTTDEVGEAQKETLVKEIVMMKFCVSSYLSNKKFQELQLLILHSWVQLVQVIVTDGNLSPLSRSNFILEVFETIIPKINDYVEVNTLFSEELTSLAVFLNDLYQKDRMVVDNLRFVDSRLYNMFKVCLHGINSPLSTPTLRSDFYVLANSYLVRRIKENTLVKEVIMDIRMHNEKLLEVICNDAIYVQGTCKITGILLLDSLIQLGNINKANFVLDNLMKGTQLQRIAQTLKSTDLLLTSTAEHITIDDLLYELTAFKTTASFLVRVAETRIGAQSLLQCKILQIIGDLSFLKIDPDLGSELIFNESPSKNSDFIKVNINLTNSINGVASSNGVSLFEVITPIFRLLCSILLSLGSTNKSVISNVKKLLMEFRKLLVGIFKKDVLKETQDTVQSTKSASEDWQELVKLAVVLCTLTQYDGRESSML